MNQNPIEGDEFQALTKSGEGLFKNKGSKFLGFSFPVKTLDEAMQKIEDLKADYHDARHWCYAYRIDPEQPAVRANDDGEPSNSAGMPIYNQLLSEGLWNVLVVVVRYFGGTKLGVSGLIEAYKTAAAEALRNSKTTKKFLLETVEISFPYALMNEVMRAAKDLAATPLEQKMGENAGIVFQIRKSQKADFEHRLARYHQIDLIDLWNE